MSKYANVWIIVPTFNRVKTLSECINTLLAQSYRNIKIIVVDDASTDNTLQIIGDNYKNVIRLSGDGNRWWSGCMNIGLSHVVANCQANDYFMSFNDDVLVDEDYVSNLVAAAALKPKSMLGSLAVDSEQCEKIVFCGNRLDWAKGIWKGNPCVDLSDDLLLATDSLPGRGVLAPVALISEIGFYDDRSFPQYFGDEDFSLKAKKAGYSLFVCANARVKSHVRMTGSGRHAPKLKEFLNSLVSIRSPNQISRRLIFIFRHCPQRFLIQFSIIDVLKVVTAYLRIKK